MSVVTPTQVIKSNLVSLSCQWCAERERRLSAGRPITTTLALLSMHDPDTCEVCWAFWARLSQEQYSNDTNEEE